MATYEDLNFWDKQKYSNAVANILYTDPAKINKRLAEIATQYDISFDDTLKEYINDKAYTQTPKKDKLRLDNEYKVRGLLNAALDGGYTDPGALADYTQGVVGDVVRSMPSVYAAANPPASDTLDTSTDASETPTVDETPAPTAEEDPAPTTSTPGVYTGRQRSRPTPTDVNLAADGGAELITTTPEAGIEELGGEELMEETPGLGELETDPNDFSEAEEKLDADIANVNPFTNWMLEYLTGGEDSEGVDPLGTALGLLSTDNIYGEDYTKSKTQLSGLLTGLTEYADAYNPEAILDNFYKVDGIGDGVGKFVNRNMTYEGQKINDLANLKATEAAKVAAETYNLGGALRSSAGAKAIAEGAAMPVAEAQAQIAQRLSELLGQQATTAFQGYTGAESEKYQGGLGARGSEIQTLTDLLKDETATKTDLAKSSADIYNDVLNNLMAYAMPDIQMSPEDEAGIIETLFDPELTWQDKADKLLEFGFDLGKLITDLKDK